MKKVNIPKELILGIDDSGRGPLIGPMALAGCIVDKKIEKEFKELGVKDSKLVSPTKRNQLAKQIKKKAIAYYASLTHPFEIDSRIKTGTNLNKIEAVKAAEIINKLKKGKKERIKAVIDCPSPNKETWKNYLLRYIKDKENLFVECEHKADRDYIAVSAASILAKDLREKEIKKIKNRIKKDFGSGYPSDPITVDFLKNHSKQYKKDGIFRQSWMTWKNHIKEKQQKKLVDY